MASENNRDTLKVLMDSLLEQHKNKLIHLPFLKGMPQASHRAELEKQIQILSTQSNPPYRFEGAWCTRLVRVIERTPIDETTELSQQIALLWIR